MSKIEIWTDGACSYNPGVGGCCAILQIDGSETIIVTDREEDSTNQRMEIMAVIKGFEKVFEYKREWYDEVNVNTDSAYVCNCVNQKWYVNWMKNGWLNSKKEPVANRELWERMFKLKKEIEDIGAKVVFTKVKGHSDNEMNNLADRLAVMATTSSRGILSYNDFYFKGVNEQ